MHRTTTQPILLLLFLISSLFLNANQSNALSVSFEQLNWIGSSTSTVDSTWGRVTLDFTGLSTTHYFNLNVNNNWVVRNMGVDSLFGPSVDQTVTTFFDLGVTDGTDVGTINYAYYFTDTPLASISSDTLTSTSVNNLDYQIGGEGDIDLGTPGAPDTPEGGNEATVTESAKLPNIDQFVNQPQKKNQCAPGAISNSLKYLQATGQLDSNIPSDISDIAGIVGTTAEGTPSDWPTVKGNHFNGTLVTTVLGPGQIDELIDAVNAGKDVELDLAGHVAVIAGVRKFSDGRVELDIFDDNQTDDMSDALKTVEIRNGKVNKKSIDGYVVEAVPEPSTMTLFSFGSLALLCRIRKNAQK